MRVRQRAADGAERHDEHACPVREAPNWHGAVDADPVLAEATRRKLFDRVVADKALDFPFPAVGKIVTDGAGYTFVPAA